MPWSFSNPYFGVIEGVGGKGEHVDVGCLDLEVRTFVVYGCSNVGGHDYEGRNDKI